MHCISFAIINYLTQRPCHSVADYLLSRWHKQSIIIIYIYFFIFSSRQHEACSVLLLLLLILLLCYYDLNINIMPL